MITYKDFDKMGHMMREEMSMNGSCMMGGMFLMVLLTILFIVLTILGIMSIIILHRKHFSKSGKRERVN